MCHCLNNYFFQNLKIPNTHLKLSVTLHFIFYRDRFRTAINVLGDAYGAGLVAHLSKDDLKEMDRVAVFGVDLDGVEITVNGGTLPEKKAIDDHLTEKTDGGVDNPTFSSTKM